MERMTAITIQTWRGYVRDAADGAVTIGRDRRAACCCQHQEECPQDLREEAAPFIRKVVEVPTPPG